jgi:hypothetical protein
VPHAARPWSPSTARCESEPNATGGREKPRLPRPPVLVQLDSERRLDRAAAGGWFSRGAAVSALRSYSSSGAPATRFDRRLSEPLGMRVPEAGRASDRAARSARAARG